MITTLIRKLFAVDTYFTIGLRQREEAVPSKSCSSVFTLLPASRQEWYADPFLCQEGGHTYLFYEKVKRDLGSIEVAELRIDGTLSDPSVLFSGDSHYSYPYVFRKDGQWCMIPESSALNEVSLYTSEFFPFKWVKQSVLLRKAAVDTTVFEWNNQWYLLTFLPSPDSERVIPLAFQMNGNQLVPMIWDEYDQLCVRGAGHPFLYNDDLIRPVQVNSDHQYGNCVAFARIEINGNHYHETVLKTLTCSNIKIRGHFFDGLHTYNACDDFIAIDVRCGKLQLSKPLRRIIRFISKKLKIHDKKAEKAV